MGWPNCSRTLTYSTLMSRQRRAAPSISAEAHTAARRRRDSRREAAPPGWPMMASAPTATLSSRSSDQRFVRSMPFIGESVTPTLFGSRRKSERPSAERAGTRMTSATCAHGTKRFTPERIQPLPDLVALAVVEAGSQSRCSSSSAAVIRARPEAMAGSHLSFCSAEPPSMSPSPPRTTVEKKGPGYAARPISSSTMASSTRPSPAPPCSSGKGSPSQPSLPISPQSSSL